MELGRRKGWLMPVALGFSMVALVALAEVGSLETDSADANPDAPAMTSPNLTFKTAALLASVPDQARVDLTAGLPGHDATVGKVDGAADVVGGAATYEIPIKMPPGRAGMQPDLSLSYSSRAGNGVAGMGWSLSGLSGITRCPATLDQDGQIRGVRLDASDKLCLDGQRLLVTGGSYGAAGATYATEINSFSRVTQLAGGLASANVNFKVETKSGEVLYYGQTSNSRVTPGGGAYPMSWLLERKEDRVGNFLHFNYTNYGSGEVLVASIVYTGFGTSDGDRRAEFGYELRPTGAGSNDASSSYIAGTVTRQTYRLKNIVTKVGPTNVRQWLLDYGNTVSAATGRSLLRGVSDCGYTGTAWVCKPQTTFTWQQGAPMYSLQAPALGFDLGDANTNDIRPVGDFDGDGSSELVVLRKDPSTGQSQSYIVSMTPERTVRWTMPIPPEYNGLYGDTLQDFNQDGRIDLIGRDASNNVIVRFWTGSPTDSNFSTAFASSWNTGVQVPIGGGSIGYIGDMDGDGRADIVMAGEAGNGTQACARRVTIYRNTPNTSDPQAAPTFSVLAQHCLASNTVNSTVNYESLDKVADFDGDSLPDLWIRSAASGLNSSTALNRIVFGVRGSSYSLQQSSFAGLFGAADAATGAELSSGLFSLWTDVNGDGLEDFVYARSESGGKWTLRMNQGGVLGARYNFSSGTGLQGCGTQSSQANCASTWQPWRAGKIKVLDYDGDGRNEIMVPTRFAANVCVHYDPDPAQCPNNDGSSLGCHAYYACAEDPTTGLSVVGGANGGLGQVATAFNSDGSPQNLIETDRFAGTYSNGLPDVSSYFMTALRFVETSPGIIELREIPTGIVANEGGEEADLYGDGASDDLVKVAAGGNPGALAVPVMKSNGDPVPTSVAPHSLPNNIPILSRNMLVNENRGPAGLLNADGLTPQTQDLMAVVTDGLGGQVVWNYSPLSGKAGRASGRTPLYTVPSTSSARYIDERHIYFTSAMQVVSDMSQSDGLGNFRSWLYGYTEAMYNTQGRGFQGFRSIVVEDEAAGTRTTTTYSQKFPLTSQPEQIIVNSLHRSGIDAPISKQLFTWRCNRANRADTAACTPQSGAPTVRFVFLDLQETYRYDAATADNPAGGTPALLGYTKQFASDNANCAENFPAASGYDLYGNLTTSITLSYDGTGAGGYRNFITRHCVRNLTSYAPADTTNWWLNKVVSKTAISSIVYNTSNQPLPAGASNPTQQVATAFTWNTNRTLATETLQGGIANQQKVTTYGYPVTNNYGLPTIVSVAASGDANGTRSSGTSYSSDGYFPLTATNPMGHAVTTLTRAIDGQPSQVTDANGLRMQIDYDPFGVPIVVRSRGVADADYVAPDKQVRMSRCSGGGCVANAVFFVRTIQDGTPIITEEKDLLGRTLRSHRSLMDGTESLVDTQYDSAGHVVKQSQPYRSGETRYWTSFIGYDVLGRVTGKVAPTSDGMTLTTNYTYLGRTTQIQVVPPAPATPLSMSRTTDGLGRYMETVDAKGGLTRYWYDASGNALAIKDANGTVLTAAYNAIGQRTQANDPNQGTWNFSYDALGEVLTQTDARGIATTDQYDRLGRTTSTTASFDYDGVAGNETISDTFTYDPVNGKGLPAGNVRKLGTLALRSETVSYDALSRPVSRAVTALRANNSTAVAVTQSVGYDGYYGRPKIQDAGNGESLWLQYSPYGAVIAETDPTTNTDYRAVQAVDASGQSVQEQWGNGMSVVRQTAPQTGQVLQIDYRSAGGASLRRFDLDYDAYGNLAWQSLNGGSSREDYIYDPLQRLTRATRSGTVSGTVNYTYDAVGNVASKSDFSTSATNAYGYAGGSCGGGPNAVKNVALLAGGNRSYCYDADGNMTSDSAGLAARYDATQHPLRIARGSVVGNFDYAPDGSRFRESGTDGELLTFGVLEKRYSAPASDKVYFANVVVTRSGASRSVQYLLTDRLGGVDSVANSSGGLVETRSYDAFGKPRTGTWADAAPPRLGTTANTPHGFTGHEHLNSLELIHMNGRVYDYGLGRFMGVDPVIQFPLNSQSLNPYSYILNNPLAGTDPTGYTCDADSDIGACSSKLDEGQKTDVVQSTLGSHIKTVIGSVTNIGGGNILVSAAGHGSAIISGMSNGAQSGACGADKSKQSSAALQPRNRAQLAVPGQTVDANFVAKTSGSRSETDGIILHRTGGATADSAMQQWKVDGLGTHFVIDENGKIIQTADIDAKTSHVGRIRSRCFDAGTCSAGEMAAIRKIGWNPARINRLEQAKAYPDRYPGNSDSIGIEVVGGYDPRTDAYSPATANQLRALSALIGALQVKYNLRNDDVYRHSQVSYKAGHEGDGLGYDP